MDKTKNRGFRKIEQEDKTYLFGWISRDNTNNEFSVSFHNPKDVKLAEFGGKETNRKFLWWGSVISFLIPACFLILAVMAGLVFLESDNTLVTLSHIGSLLLGFVLTLPVPFVMFSFSRKVESAEERMVKEDTRTYVRVHDSTNTTDYRFLFPSYEKKTYTNMKTGEESTHFEASDPGMDIMRSDTVRLDRRSLTDDELMELYRLQRTVDESVKDHLAVLKEKHNAKYGAVSKEERKSSPLIKSKEEKMKESQEKFRKAYEAQSDFIRMTVQKQKGSSLTV